MCGHVGIAGELEFKDEATLKRLLLADFFRGPDSTGVAFVSKKDEINIAKIPSHPIDLFQSKAFISNLSYFNNKAFIGHNRLATKGVINYDNAHPYEYGDIVGAHNGTLTVESWVALEKIVGKTDVDSQAIIKAIDKIGIEETVKHLQGAWALVWFDKSDNTLNFLRNKEREFWYAYTEEQDKIFWASEWQIMDFSLDMASTPYSIYTDNEGHKYWATMPDWWYRYDLDKMKLNTKDTKVKARVKELKGKPVPVTTPAVAAGGANFTVTPPWHQQTTTPSNVTRIGSGTISDDGPKFLGLIATAEDPYASYISEAEFTRIAKYGCSWCMADIDYGDQGLTIYPEIDTILCSECSHHDDTRIYSDKSSMKKFAESNAN